MSGRGEHRVRSPRRRLLHALTVLSLALIVLGTVVAAAHSQFTSTSSSTMTTSSLTVGNPTAGAGSLQTGALGICLSIQITWTAAPNADSYRVQVREDAGAWTDLVTESANVTTVTDPTIRLASSVTYRVYGRDAGSNWEGSTPSVTAPVSLLSC